MKVAAATAAAAAATAAGVVATRKIRESAAAAPAPEQTTLDYSADTPASNDTGDFEGGGGATPVL